MRIIILEQGNAARRFFFFLLLSGFLIQPAPLPAKGKKSASHPNRQTTVLHAPVLTPDQLRLPNGLLWPTNASKLLASSFAETRSNHFHMGLDIRTQGRVGFPCYAIDDGYVSRLKVSPYGYGRALYFTLKDGRTIAAFAHLQKFAPPVEKLLHAEQMRLRNFTCEMFFKPDDLPYKKGEIICYTGDTGAGPPHLHFEMRDDKGYCNPGLFGFVVPDTIAPMPRKMGLFPLGVDAEINNDYHPLLLSLTGLGQNRYSVKQVPSVYGPVGLGIAGHDQVDESGNALGF
jgi:murein DD-endopeptidase MepM/ murein hydrolase activator NlpD